MPWFKVDDGFYTSRKVLSIPRRHRLAAVGLWTLAGNWSARELSDGLVPAYVLEELGATPTIVRTLVEARLWLDQASTEARPTLDQPAGWVMFHNWHEYQPTRDQVETDRANTRERQRRHRETKRDERVTNADVTRDSHVSHSVPTRPDPTRPEVTKVTSPEGAAGGKKPDVRMPSDWVPTAAHYERAKEGRIDILREAEAFKLHAEAHDRHAANWNAAFTQWLMKAKPSAPTKRDPNAWMNQ